MQRMLKLGLLAVAMLMIPGCTSNGVTGLPGGAMLSAEGSSKLNFTAKDKGSVYLRDQPADRVIYEGAIEPSQQLMVDVKNHRVTLGGQRVATKTDLRTDATYQIFFKPAEHHEYHPMMNP